MVEDDSGIEPDQQWIYIRIAVEEQQLQKVLQFNLEESVWKAKEKVFQVLIKELPEWFNYGLYLPAYNGRAGKFLDESRCLKEYPLNGPVSSLELKYKRRVYRSVDLLHKHLQFKCNAKKFLELVKSNQVAKVGRYLEKGFDPNIHLSDWETPLICACIDLLEPRSMVMTLVNGGAHLDFRSRKEGLTPLHQTAKFSRKEAMLTLLELGASANVYDGNHLTPLYLTIVSNSQGVQIDSSSCCLLLLEDHSMVNTVDANQSSEVHQCCRLGLVQHLEHLLFYRCDLNGVDRRGNTPLHICAMTNGESCARILLYRGANLQLRNHCQQTASQFALLHGNARLAELIDSHRSEDVVPFVDHPFINPKRRSIFFDCSSRGRVSRNPRSISMPKLHPSTGSRSQSPKSSSLHSDQGFSSQSNSHLSLHSPNPSMRKRLYQTIPGRTSLCIQPYKANSPGELSLNQGDLIQIVNVGEDGFVEGICNGSQGWIPVNHLQEISILKEDPELLEEERVGLNREQFSALLLKSEQFRPRTIVLQKGKKGFGFVLRGSRIAGKYFQPSVSFPALQFLDSIEKGSNAERAGLKQNDYVLEINAINVISMPHEECVQLIKRSGDTLALKVITSPYQNLSTHPGPFSKKSSLALPGSFHPPSSLRSVNPHSFEDDLDGRLTDYEYGSLIVPLPSHTDDNASSFSHKQQMKPFLPERDSSLSESHCPEKVPRETSTSSSNEGDEEESFSSSNSTELFKITSSPPPMPPSNPMSTFKGTSNPTELKNDWQGEIEAAKTRLKKVDEGSPPAASDCKESLFPPPPSPRTLRRSSECPPKSQDPRSDVNFSAVIAQRAAEAKARRHENPSGLDFHSNGLPPATTFFNHCVTTDRIPANVPLNVKCPQRFSTTANQLLDNLKRRGPNSSFSSTNSFLPE